MTFDEFMETHGAKFKMAMLLFWMMWTVYLSAHLGQEVAEGDLTWTIAYIVMIVVAMSLLLIEYFTWHLVSLKKVKKRKTYIWGNQVMQFIPKEKE